MAKVVGDDINSYIQFWLVPLVIGLLIWFLYSALDGLVIIGMSIFLALALRPLVRRVENLFKKWFGEDKKHAKASSILAYLLVVIVLGAAIAIIGPTVVSETAKFIEQAPEMFENTIGGWEGINSFGRNIGIEDLQSEITSAVSNLSSSILGNVGQDFVSNISSVANTVTKLVFVLVLTLLFLLEGPEMNNSFWINISGGDNKLAKAIRRLISRMANVVSTYVSKQLTIAVIDGVASGIIVFCLSLFLGVSSGLAIPMGLTTAVFYMIPMFGQLIGGAIVTVILLFNNPIAALVFAVIYIIYAQIENNIISPRIQGDALKLPAVAILSAAVIGTYMFGLLGAIIAIPIAGCIRVFIEEYPNLRLAQKES